MELGPSNPEWNKFPGPEAEGDSNEAGEKDHRFSSVIFKVYQLHFPISTLRIDLRVPTKLGHLKRSFGQLSEFETVIRKCFPKVLN